MRNRGREEREREWEKREEGGGKRERGEIYKGSRPMNIFILHNEL